MHPSERIRLARGALLLAAAIGVASPVAAQDEEQTALARSLFTQGVSLSDAGDWAGAADHFRRSLSLRWSPVVAFNLGTAYAHVGHLALAEELFRQAARDETAPARLREAAEAQLVQLGPRLARLTIEITGSREGVVLRLDDREVPEAAIGVAAPADPGAHVLVALRGEREVARQSIELAEGAEGVIALEIPPPAEIPLPRETAERAPRETPIAAVPAQAPAPRGGDDTLLVALAIAGGILVVGAAAAITAVLVLEDQGHGDPVDGNLGPAVIVFE